MRCEIVILRDPRVEFAERMFKTLRAFTVQVSLVRSRDELSRHDDP